MPQSATPGISITEDEAHYPASAVSLVISSCWQLMSSNKIPAGAGLYFGYAGGSKVDLKSPGK
jgi:hypothetical protein